MIVKTRADRRQWEFHLEIQVAFFTISAFYMTGWFWISNFFFQYFRLDPTWVQTFLQFNWLINEFIIVGDGVPDWCSKNVIFVFFHFVLHRCHREILITLFFHLYIFAIHFHWFKEGHFYFFSVRNTKKKRFYFTLY